MRYLKKDLRPISLTSCLSKVAEDFVVTDHLKPAVMKVLDSNQYGAVPKSSTTIALLNMIHEWITGTDAKDLLSELSFLIIERLSI